MCIRDRSGYVDLLLEDGSATSAERVAPSMRREVDRMNHLVQDLLALTRLDAAPWDSEAADEVDLVQVAEAMVSAMARAAGSRQLITDQRCSGELCVRADGYAMEQVFENLLRNAVQHTSDDGRVVIQLDEQDGHARVQVIDDGEGMPPEHQARVFDRFYRVDPARAREQGNAGLGLAIVKAIVIRHGGQVSVQSEPGSGSTFMVLLPLVAPAPADHP